MQPPETEPTTEPLSHRAMIDPTGLGDDPHVRTTVANSLVGYDIDAMNQLATDMGVKVEFVTTEWATLVNGIVSDRYDVFAGGSSLNMARAKTVAFTSPYIFEGHGVEITGGAHPQGSALQNLGEF